ncbi:MAG: biotin-dependent carboxyltransferase [Actinobacteria bacterium]|nr:MAG: biotin-dependent carboxyltransferase [Actinomycetota bacterium]
MTLLVMHPGALSTVQDLGRPGYGSAGVAPSGAMDPWALRAANVLVSNEEGAAAIEFTMRGPTIAFEDDTIVALTGSRFEVSILRSVSGSAFERDVDATTAPHQTSFRLRAGESLRMGATLGGARGYLAIRGGIDVPLVLGSRSTHVAAGLGGRVLSQGDRLTTGPATDAPLRRARLDAAYRSEQRLRAIPGPQRDVFLPGSVERFFSSPYTVTARSDRTGIRLQGLPLELGTKSDIDPEGVVTGALQIPGDGQPILLGCDRPATGGYAKVATVIGADMHLAAQAKPGDTFSFDRTTPEAARAAWREREDAWRGTIEDID